MLRSKLPLVVALFASSVGVGVCYGATAPAAGPTPEQVQANQTWATVSKDLDWAHPTYFDGRKGTDFLVVADKSPATTAVVCNDAPVGQFGMAKFSGNGADKKSYPLSGGAGGACYLFKDVTYLQVNAASDSPRWWGRYYIVVPKKK